MTQHASERNPFMLMVNPEVVLAAVAKSVRLGQLNRHLCRPLDRPVAGSTGNAGADGDSVADEDEPSDDETGAAGA